MISSAFVRVSQYRRRRYWRSRIGNDQRGRWKIARLPSLTKKQAIAATISKTCERTSILRQATAKSQLLIDRQAPRSYRIVSFGSRPRFLWTRKVSRSLECVSVTYLPFPFVTPAPWSAPVPDRALQFVDFTERPRVGCRCRGRPLQRFWPDRLACPFNLERPSRNTCRRAFWQQ